jgi:hypothetical protein
MQMLAHKLTSRREMIFVIRGGGGGGGTMGISQTIAKITTVATTTIKIRFLFNPTSLLLRLLFLQNGM